MFGGSPSQVAAINHGTYFYHAAMEGLLRNDTNIHAGIRTTLSGPSDYENDGYCGFEIVEAREIDTIGIFSFLNFSFQPANGLHRHGRHHQKDSGSRRNRAPGLPVHRYRHFGPSL